MSSEREAQPGKRKFFRFWRVFWLATLVGSLGYAWYCFYVPGNDVAWAHDQAAAQQASAESGKPAILYFTAKWCVPCRIMRRQVWADDEVATLVNAEFVPAMIDVDDASSTAILGRYQVGAWPTTIIIDSRGEVLQRVEGGMARDDFLALLRTVE